MTRICGEEVGRPHDGAYNCQFVSSIVLVACLAIAAYGAVVLSRQNPYTYTQGVSMMAAGGAVAFAALLLLASACRQTSTGCSHSDSFSRSNSSRWIESPAYGQPRREGPQARHRDAYPRMPWTHPSAPPPYTEPPPPPPPYQPAQGLLPPAG